METSVRLRGQEARVDPRILIVAAILPLRCRPSRQKHKRALGVGKLRQGPACSPVQVATRIGARPANTEGRAEAGETSFLTRGGTRLSASSEPQGGGVRGTHVARAEGDALRVLVAELIPWRGEDSRHASSGERAYGFLGR
ncbi:MAG: hypothetical protein K0R61_4686 [Microvirga sp.]|jgi:hypothetical protein|nr:hypothetical protein [Microvirga sp.]